jgi:alkylation response protein AidB-like acyl-CoA dehydrogenase
MCGNHSFNEVFFDNVRVRKKNIVGEIDRGWYYLMVALDFERLAVAIGGFRRTFEELVQYAKETKYNGQTLSSNPLVQNKLAEIKVEIEVAYMFFWQTAWMLDQSLSTNIGASVLKLFTTELSHKLAVTCMDVIGPYRRKDLHGLLGLCICTHRCWHLGNSAQYNCYSGTRATLGIEESVIPR